MQKHVTLTIDTTNLKPKQLRSRLLQEFTHLTEQQLMEVHVFSFGFKYGMPEEADIIIDVRFLPNPYWNPEMRPLTGRDALAPDRRTVGIIDLHLDGTNRGRQPRDSGRDASDSTRLERPDDVLLADFAGEPTELARSDQNARPLVGFGHCLRGERRALRLDNRNHRQAVSPRELEVTLVVCGHSHDGSRPVLHQHEIGDVDR
jgi:hypothetical protein